MVDNVFNASVFGLITVVAALASVQIIQAELEIERATRIAEAQPAWLPTVAVSDHAASESSPGTAVAAVFPLTAESS